MTCVDTVMFNKRIGNVMCLQCNVQKTDRAQYVFTALCSINGMVMICVYRVTFQKRIGNNICLPRYVQ
jgi:hypothetical protein